MRVAVVGGKLQGVEAVYLAHKAGWEVTLIDRSVEVPAAGLCDNLVTMDVIREAELVLALNNIDLVIPAMENREALASLVKVTEDLQIPLLFDEHAYSISASKLASNELFSLLGVPAPIPWPACGFPIIAKPSDASGSEGVVRLDTMAEYRSELAKLENDQSWVIEEYLEGPSFSIEVIGYQGNYRVLQITELEMDRVYDCKRVLAPVELEYRQKQEFEQIALTLARDLKLQGIMDVETILHQGKLKVLEIDARLPSQTPTAVYCSTGINMLRLLGESFTGEGSQPCPGKECPKGVVYEHIRVSKDRVEVCGEHIMGEAGPLTLRNNFFGADEAITNYLPGVGEWVATLIITGPNREQAWDTRCQVIERIRNELELSQYVDQQPALGRSANYKC